MALAQAAPPHGALLVATMADVSTPWAEQLALVQSRVEGATDGELRYRVFPGRDLAHEAELVLAVARGEGLDGALVTTTTLAVTLDLPLLLLPELPYLFEDQAELDEVLDELLFPHVQRALAERGLLLAAWSELGWRNLSLRGAPARTPADLAGHRLRAQPDLPLHVWTLEAMGARRAVPMPALECKPRLMQQEVTGFDAPPATALLSGWLDQVDTTSLTRHAWQGAALVYRAASLEGLKGSERAAVLGDRRVDSALAREAARAFDAQVLEAMARAGHALAPVEDTTPFAEATRGVHQRLLDENPELRPVYDEVMRHLTARRRDAAEPRR